MHNTKKKENTTHNALDFFLASKFPVIYLNFLIVVILQFRSYFSILSCRSWVTFGPTEVEDRRQYHFSFLLND